MDDFIYHDDDICLRLGLITKPSKSFVSQIGFVFCENYFVGYDLDPKYGYLVRAFKICEIAVNIVHAKALFNSLEWCDKYSLEYRDRLIAIWGYEFHPDEGSLPLSCGGWSTPRVLGIRADLLYIPNSHQDYLGAMASASGEI